jgi:hypothetical protein
MQNFMIGISIARLLNRRWSGFGSPIGACLVPRGHAPHWRAFFILGLMLAPYPLHAQISSLSPFALSVQSWARVGNAQMRPIEDRQIAQAHE